MIGGKLPLHVVVNRGNSFLVRAQAVKRNAANGGVSIVEPEGRVLLILEVQECPRGELEKPGHEFLQNAVSPCTPFNASDARTHTSARA